MNTLSGNVHIVSGYGDTIDAVFELLAKEGIETKGNPDIFARTYASFGIDDAHELTARAAARAFGSAQPSPRLRPARRVFVIAADTMTSEAQNALLKTIEEPSADSLFFFIVPSPETLLSTFRSRAQMLLLKDATDKDAQDNARAFLKASQAKRLELLKPLLEKSDDDRRDLGAIIAFLASLERSLADDAKKNDMREGLTANRQGIEAIYRARMFISDRGALVKPLLEQVALLAPQL